MLKKFSRTEGGNVAILFGLVLIPLLAAAGMAVDFAYAAKIRAEAAEAADSGLLASARARLLNETLSNADAEAIARRFFDSNTDLRDNVDYELFDLDLDAADDTATLRVSGSIRTYLLGVIGYKTLPLTLMTQAKVGSPRLLEAILILDNTNSMAGDKLAALKDSASELVETLMKNDDGNVRLGLVPFSNYVNIGLSRRDESWLDVPDDYSTTTYSCRNTYPDRITSNCYEYESTCTNDGVTSACTKTHCDVDNGEPVQECRDRTSTYTWRGCVGSRSNPWDARDKEFDTRPVPGLLNINCTREILPLSSDKAAIKSKISSMFTQGDTYIPAGMTWGMRLISNISPFTEGTPYEEHYTANGVKAIVLMTDGANTRSADYPRHAGWDRNAADAKTEDLCDAMKVEKIAVYTIAFEVSDMGIQDLLEGCASAPANYFNAEDSTDLAAAFNAIASSLQEIALTR